MFQASAHRATKEAEGVSSEEAAAWWDGEEMKRRRRAQIPGRTRGERERRRSLCPSMDSFFVRVVFVREGLLRVWSDLLEGIRSALEFDLRGRRIRSIVVLVFLGQLVLRRHLHLASLGCRFATLPDEVDAGESRGDEKNANHGNNGNQPGT